MGSSSITADDTMTSSELLQAQAHVWHHTFNFVTSMSLKCAVQLGIPEAIHSHGGGRPISVPDLVADLKIPPSKSPYLHRLLRVLVHSGFLIHHYTGGESGSYSLTAAGRYLVRDKPLNGGAFVVMLLDPVLVNAFHDMSAWFLSEKDDSTPFYAAHGKQVWEYMGDDLKMNDVFNEAMATDSCLIAKVAVKEGKAAFEGVGSLVDLAGGTGTMAKVIAASFPEMDCVVMDLPHVVSGLEGNGNLKFLAGDMFDSVPPADAVLLKWILHDWSDENCVRILKNCKKAVTATSYNGKVIIIDMVLGGKNLDEKTKTVQYGFDIEMMVNASGKERDEEEWAKIFVEAGFTRYHIRPIFGARSLIEVYP
ncbi:Trans-resveratrol di-O-methyltransferase [Linum grandiflorum]